MKRLALPFLIVCHLTVFAQGAVRQFADGAQGTRWEFAPDGGIRWRVTGGASHTDHIEMSGRRVSAIITYGVDSLQRLVWHRQLVFPMLRTIPNDTHGSLHSSFEDNIIDAVTVGGQKLEETPAEFSINGYLRVISQTNMPIRVTRCFYPSTDKAACLETYELFNTGTQPLAVHVPVIDRETATAAAKGVYGVYTLASASFLSRDTVLPAGGSYFFYMVFGGRRGTEEPAYISAAYEFEKRKQLVDGLEGRLVLHTPNDTLDRMFAFAKVRVAESIFDTKGGLMHGPGGGSYYAAIWANDQAEYVGPFFPFLGNAAAIESARNCYRLFAGYMNTAYKPIPSSIIAEGVGTWNGAGDRGDQAMVAYGAARFALAYGDVQEARQLWPLITWCLEYLRRQRTAAGVIASTSDELEGRFPTGKINLSTNVLTYGALVSAGHLAAALGEADVYSARADELRAAIEKYFGGAVQGFNTYRYYEGNTTLRSWICLPLVMGINDRKEETIKALLSKYLWSKNGILTESGSQTFWDRSTLYAFRGLFYAGATDTSLKYLNYYSAMRLLGEHVPYAVEAWPEGDQRHLSAESGLYCRIITEGLFGIEPTGFDAFTLMPRLPNGWDHMSLEHIRAFQQDFSIAVSRDGQGEKVIVTVTGQAPVVYNWDGVQPLNIHLSGAGGARQEIGSAGRVSFSSSDTALARAFSWAKEMALHYRGKPDDPVGPWYESALPPRDAFCMRDVSHQCIGAEILGLHRENQNMFSKFTGHISGSKDWCSYWEIDKEDRPSPSDYRNDSAFWYNLNANFDVMDACWRVYLWTGDALYLKDAAYKNFYDRSANEFLKKWILEADELLSRPAYPNAPVPFNIEDAFHRCRGLPSYSEGVPNLKMGVDLIAAIYRGLSSYAAMYPGNERYLAKANAYRRRIDADWWDPQAGLYHTHFTNDRVFGKAEGETFLLWFDAIKDSVRKARTIRHLLTLDLNVENLSYLPLQYYRNGYPNEARALILHLADPATKRREYPEVSFGMVEAVVQGLMGVEADARRHMVCTRYRGVGRSTLSDLPVLNTTVTLVHFGNGKSMLKNTGGVAIRWRCEKESRGRIVSFKEVDLAPGQEKIIQL